MAEQNTSKLYSLNGIWTVYTEDGKPYDMRIPGTLDESNIGHPDTPDNTGALKGPDIPKDPLDRLLSEEGLLLSEEEEKEETVSEKEPIMTRYTRKYSYEGLVYITRSVTYKEVAGRRLFLEVERARVLHLFIDEAEVPLFMPASLATPWVFEVTGRLNGTHSVTIISDNSYRGLPYEEIVTSNMASEDTQTNWNGLLGYVRLREETEVFVDALDVRPKDNEVEVRVEISAPFPCETAIRITSPAFTREYVTKIKIRENFAGFVFDGLKLREDVKKWDEGEGNLQTVKVELQNGETKTATFGVRTFSVDENYNFTLNGRPIYLRGETNAAVHPDTSYCPMDKLSWTRMFKQYKAYGANFVRFASHCPPDIAFQAADELGMLLMVGLSCHQHAGAYRTEEAREYYRTEAVRILKTYGNHPSFVMMSFGSGAETTLEMSDYLKELLSLARSIDNTRLYTPGAGVITEESDFVMVDKREDLPQRVKLPVMTVRTGQFEILPDFSEIDLFSGVLSPDNLIQMRENVEKAGLQGSWQRLVEASGETAFRRYKEAVENCFLDDRISGVTVMGLTDIPGHGRAPVGMMNAHLVSKSYDFASPKRFSEFFAPQAVLSAHRRNAYSYGETLSLPVYVMNYGREPLDYPLRAMLSDGDISIERTFDRVEVAPGEVRKVGELSVPLDREMGEEKKTRELKLTLRFGLLENHYPIFVYPSLVPICPENVLEVSELNDRAIQYLEEGGNVLITPPVPSVFSRGGRYIEKNHPVFERFKAEYYPEENWRSIPNVKGYELPARFKAMVTKLSQPSDLTRCVQLFETRMLNGAVMVSALGMKERIDKPEVAALLACIYDYMGSYQFSPNQEMKVQELREILETFRIEA